LTDMFDDNKMLLLAKDARFKPNLILQILIFFAVFTAASVVASVIVMIPTMAWLFMSPDFMDFAMAGDVESALELLYNMPDWMIIVSLFATIGEIAAPIIYCRYIERRKIASLGIVKKGAVKSYLAGYLVGVLMMTAVVGVCLICKAITIEAATSISVLYILLFFVGYLVQGFAEEILCRGYFMVSLTNSLKGKYSAAIAVAVSSVVFALLHLGNQGVSPLSVLNIVLAGMFFGIYVLRTGNIWGAAAAHSAWNFVQGQIFGMSVSGVESNAMVFKTTVCEGFEWLTGGTFGPEGGMAVTIVMLIAILLVTVFPIKHDTDTIAE